MRLLGSNSDGRAWEHTPLPTKQSHQLSLESSDICLHKFWVKQAYEGLSLEGLVFLCPLSSGLKSVQSLSLSFSYNKMPGSFFSQRVCLFVSGDWKEGSLGCCHWRHHVLEHGIFATCRGQILTPHFWSQFMWKGVSDLFEVDLGWRHVWVCMWCHPFLLFFFFKTPGLWGCSTCDLALDENGMSFHGCREPSCPSFSGHTLICVS